MSALLRSLEIDLVLDNSNEIIDIFNGVWSGLIVIEKDVYHKDGGEIIYYILNDNIKEWIFLQDEKNHKFKCSYERYWSLFESKIDLNYDDIQALTKLLLENALNSSVSTPKWSTLTVNSTVDNALNSSVSTPFIRCASMLIEVDNALNSSV